MSHPGGYSFAMKMNTESQILFSSSIELVWSHGGVRYRVDSGMNFFREGAAGWEAWLPDPASSVFCSAADQISETRWRAFLEYAPVRVRTLVCLFEEGRAAALAVAAFCPGLVADLLATPALVPFLAEHTRLRGEAQPRWAEINAVHARGGLYGLLDWLGLPASRQSLGILQKIAMPDLARRLLEPIRTSLWEPETLWLLQQMPSLSERALAHHCECVAA